MLITEVIIGEHARVAISGKIRVVCLCGCGRVKDVNLDTREFDLGTVGIWEHQMMELAIGFHAGLLQPRFYEVLSEAADNG